MGAGGREERLPRLQRRGREERLPLQRLPNLQRRGRFYEPQAGLKPRGRWRGLRQALGSGLQLNVRQEQLRVIVVLLLQLGKCRP